VLDYSSSPLLVFYEVTQACDLICQHCRACAQTAAHPAELKRDESLLLIDQLAEFPTPPILVLTGGDPLKRRDIFELIEHATRRGLEVSITPSATPLVTADAVRRLRDAGIARMAISIDGADAETHDRTRGVRGSFARSLEILSAARDVGLSVQVNTTVTPMNVDQIDRMAEMLAQNGIVMWSVFFLIPVGRAEQIARLDAEQSEAAFANLWRHAKQQPYAIKTTEAPHYRRFSLQQQVSKSQREPSNGQASNGQPSNGPPSYVSAGVNDGKGVMFISHAGLIHPSGFLPITCGVFPLQHVVQVYQDSPVFRALRDAERLEGKCHACEFRKICGGSRARAYAVTGELFAEEPDCAYIPAGYQPG
jgi:radical SAM protein